MLLQGGQTPIMMACRYNFRNTAQFLIIRGADIDLRDQVRCFLQVIFASNYWISMYLFKDGWTALIVVCQLDEDRTDCARLLLEHGCNTQIRDAVSKTL